MIKYWYDEEQEEKISKLIVSSPLVVDSFFRCEQTHTRMDKFKKKKSNLPPWLIRTDICIPERGFDTVEPW